MNLTCDKPGKHQRALHNLDHSCLFELDRVIQSPNEPRDSRTDVGFDETFVILEPLFLRPFPVVKSCFQDPVISFFAKSFSLFLGTIFCMKSLEDRLKKTIKPPVFLLSQRLELFLEASLNSVSHSALSNSYEHKWEPLKVPANLSKSTLLLSNDLF